MADEKEKGLYYVKHKSRAVILFVSCIQVSFGLDQELYNLQMILPSTVV